MIPVVLALTGACLVVFGAREPLVHMPVGDTSLADASQFVTWTVRAAAVAVLVFVASRMRWPGWLAWLVAVGALGYVAYDLSSQIAGLKRSAVEADDPSMLRMVQQTISETRLKPGSVYLLGGFLIQLMALLIRPGARGKNKR
jgi:hypothetical protein